MQTAWILDARRTPFTRATRGALASRRPDDLLADLFRQLLATLPPAACDRLDEVVVGCAYPEAEQGRNMARLVSLNAQIPDRVPAMTLTRMCASSLEATAVAGAKVRLGEASLVLVGGVESMSLIPTGGVKPSPNPGLESRRPEVYMAMGLTAERVARRYGISRLDQDDWVVQSHGRACNSRRRGILAEEILAVDAAPPAASGEANGVVSEDDALRSDTSLERLAELETVFQENGTVTAGNSCPMSDGASALLVASASVVSDLGLEPLGRLVSYAVAGIDPAMMGMGPVHAVPRALASAGLEIADIDVIELNEAFSAQVLAVMRALGLPAERTNLNGGALALGHPLGATGARLVGTLLRQLRRSHGRYGLATLCVGGGMGAAMVVENSGVR